MKSRSEICLAPSGNGSLLEAIRQNKEAIEILREMDFVQVVGVDNALAKILDPIQIGFTQSQQLTMSAKIVAKRNQDEQLSIIGRENGLYKAIPYDEITYD